MIATPNQVWLVVEAIDLRAYVEFPVMQSCRRRMNFDFGKSRI
jgi:hypothetical protein